MTGPRLLADENIAASLVRALREDGIDVSYVAELASGITDDEVLDLAKAEARLLLTEDKDFGELVFRMKRRRARRAAVAGTTLATISKPWTLANCPSPPR
jgi:uncharacterized protein with PIN domain